jgi:hypothetical protein
VFESDLAPLVDFSSLPSPLLDDIPTGAFLGAGDAFNDDDDDDGSSFDYVAWRPEFVKQENGAFGCDGVNPSLWNGTATLQFPPVNKDGVSHLVLAPLWGNAASGGGRVALLGEAGKVAAVSTYRFERAAPAPAGGGVELSLRGGPGEIVPLLFAVENGEATESFGCVAVNASLGSDGTASISFPATI